MSGERAAGPDFPTHCWCGEPVQQASDHRCRQCAEHCEMRAYEEGRPSPRDPGGAR